MKNIPNHQSDIELPYNASATKSPLQLRPHDGPEFVPDGREPGTDG